MNTWIPNRVTEKVLIEEAKEYAKRHGLIYGREKGNICIKGTDGRIAPYNYQLVRFISDGGAMSTITGAMKNRDLYMFLKWA